MTVYIYWTENQCFVQIEQNGIGLFCLFHLGLTLTWPALRAYFDSISRQNCVPIYSDTVLLFLLLPNDVTATLFENPLSRILPYCRCCNSFLENWSRRIDINDLNNSNNPKTGSFSISIQTSRHGVTLLEKRVRSDCAWIQTASETLLLPRLRFSRSKRTHSGGRLWVIGTGKSATQRMLHSIDISNDVPLSRLRKHAWVMKRKEETMTGLF